MAFNSFTFLWVFLPLFFAGALLFRGRSGNVFLLAANLIFYTWGEPKFILLFILSIAFNYIGGIMLEKENRNRRLTAGVTICIDILLLGYFKYYNFFGDTVNRLFDRQTVPLRNIALPLGISFYTFQAVAYIMDVLRKRIPAERSIIKFAAFMSFFPTIVSGPILRYGDVKNALDRRQLRPDRAADGLARFCFGMAKKVLIANTLGNTVDAILSAEFSQLSPLLGWVAAFFYTLQIYFDFSGYSDMAIGIAYALGFTIPENFEDPYQAVSMQDFWRRWHISLSTWFRDYLYIPLGGNRKGRLRTLLNLAVVFAVTGLWHGAQWTFVVWGLYHGLFIILERIGLGKGLPTPCRRVLTFVAVCIGWVFFRADTLQAAFDQIRLMFGLLPFQCAWQLSEFVPLTGWVMFAAAGLLSTGLRSRMKAYLCTHDLVRFALAPVLLFISIVFLANAAHHPFIYFRF